LVGARHATGIQKQDTSTLFISRDVCVSVKDDIDVIRRAIRRYVLQTEFQSASHKIDNERPLESTVAISSHDGYSRPDCVELIENAFRANISEMPDFIRVFGNVLHLFRQTIVRVRQDKNAQYLFRFLLIRHSRARLPLQTATHLVSCPHASIRALIYTMADVT
jgi:hypothetical protein